MDSLCVSRKLKFLQLRQEEIPAGLSAPACFLFVSNLHSCKKSNISPSGEVR